MGAMEQLQQDCVNKLMPSDSDFCDEFVRDFITENLQYVNEHRYSDRDLEKAMTWRSLINARYKETKGTPQMGDIVHIYGDNGKEYARARITEGFDGGLSICTQPYIPWVSGFNSGKIMTNTSGGYFRECKPEKLELLGKETAQFLDWGRLGSGGNQAIYFSATVNHWKLVDKEFY